MDFEYINVNQICSLKVSTFSKSNYYEYKKTKKTFFGKMTKEGFYDYDDYCSVQQIEARGEYICKGEEVFLKPYIVIRMSNNDNHKKIFHTNEEMFKFIWNSQLSTLKWINKKDILESRQVLLELYKGYPDEYRILSKRTLETNY